MAQLIPQVLKCQKKKRLIISGQEYYSAFTITKCVETLSIKEHPGERMARMENFATLQQ